MQISEMGEELKSQTSNKEQEKSYIYIMPKASGMNDFKDRIHQQRNDKKEEVGKNYFNKKEDKITGVRNMLNSLKR